MKKTLIAALLCAPMALASTVAQLNSQIKSEITSSGYTNGDQYELVLTLKGVGTNSLLQLADGVYVVSQVGKYLGINTVGSNGGSIAWPSAAPGATTVDDITTTTVTFDSATGNANWVSYDKDGTNHNEKIVNNSTLTLSYDGTDTKLSMAYADTNAGLVNEVVWTGTSFDVNDFVFGAANGGTDIVSFKVTTPATPEPATATLSLLALAGLASRRRRH